MKRAFFIALISSALLFSGLFLIEILQNSYSEPELAIKEKTSVLENSMKYKDTVDIYFFDKKTQAIAYENQNGNINVAYLKKNLLNRWTYITSSQEIPTTKPDENAQITKVYLEFERGKSLWFGTIFDSNFNTIELRGTQAAILDFKEIRYWHLKSDDDSAKLAAYNKDGNSIYQER